MNGFNSNLLDGKTKLHFVGIGGSGMFPLVQILHAVGYEITGSDVGEGDIVDREKAMGIPVYHGHRAENVHGAQLVVYTAAIMKGNPEIEEARRLGIPTVERSVTAGLCDKHLPLPHLHFRHARQNHHHRHDGADYGHGRAGPRRRHRRQAAPYRRLWPLWRGAQYRGGGVRIPQHLFAACTAHVRHSEYRRGPSGIL